MKKNFLTNDALTGFDSGLLERVGNAACYPQGQCSMKHLVENYELYDRTYTVEDSIQLRAMSIFGSKMLDGGYITVIPNVKDKVPLYRDEMEIWYQSAGNGGKGATDCGPFRGKGKVNQVTNKFLSVCYMYMEANICYKKLIGTFKQNLLMQGALGSEDNTALNDRLLDKMISNSNRQTDMLIWMGDYGSPIDMLAHYDGIVKRIYNAINAQTNQTYTIQYTGAGIAATECVKLRVGGETTEVAFNTDLATTLVDVQTYLISLLHPVTQQPLVSVATNGVDTLTVISNFYYLPIEVLIDTVTCGSPAACGIDTGCCGSDWTVTETVPYVAVDKPLTVPYEPVTMGNVIGIFTKMYLKVAAENPELLSEADFYFHVSDHVWAILIAAQANLTAAFQGLANVNTTPSPFGLRIVSQPGLRDHIIIGTRTANIFFGTDLMSDRTNTQQWVNRDCEEVRFRHAVFQGVQVDRYRETVSNLDCAPLTFKPMKTPDGDIFAC